MGSIMFKDSCAMLNGSLATCLSNVKDEDKTYLGSGATPRGTSA